MTSNDLCLMAATELLEAYAGRTVSPVEVMTAVFARSEALNPRSTLFSISSAKAPWSKLAPPKHAAEPAAPWACWMAFP